MTTYFDYPWVVGMTGIIVVDDLLISILFLLSQNVKYAWGFTYKLY